MKISRAGVDGAKLEASGHAKELCWLATNEALLHVDSDRRMTVGSLVEYVAREQMHAMNGANGSAGACYSSEV